MTKANQQCHSPDSILAFLRGGLTSSEEESLQHHLNDCVACRQLLSSSAADEAAWAEAQQFFSSEALDNALCLGEAQLRGAHGTNAEHAEEPESIESLLKLLGPTDDPRMLGRIGPYEIVGVLGRGGMGVVFKAYEPSLNRYVAIKLLLPHLAASGAARMRFAREGRAAAAVIDDNVLPIFSVSEWQGTPYLVTQLSRGSNLQKRINDSGPLELREVLRLGMQTASGLAAAHAQGLVHRDVKPSNILLDGTVDRALLTDFGLARAVDDASITCSGIIAGTPQYMSPEQARGGAVDARSDLFGLGSVLYTMCTGRPPFRAENSFAVLRLITDVQPRAIREINPDIPEWLCAIIEKLMAKSPEDRYQSASEVAGLLSACLAHVQQPTVVGLPNELRETMDRHRFAESSRNNWRRTLAHHITYHMPSWLPCFLTTLIAFAVSLGPAMTLPTLPKETFLHSIPPATAILIVTALGFAWGLAITLAAKRVATETDAAEQPKRLPTLTLFMVGGAIVALAVVVPWLMRQSRLAEELTDSKKQLLAATARETMAREQAEESGLAAVAQQTGEIIGYLKNDAGEPIRNATIACSCVYDKAGQGGGANAITDAEGRFQVSGLTAGIYSVWLKHYDNPHFTAIADDGIEVTGGQSATSTLSLVPTIHVTGLVTREGMPATTGTSVQCFCSARPESSATALTALTDEQGRFALDLPRGRASFVAMGRSQESNALLVSKLQFTVGQEKEPAREPFGDVHLELRPQQSQFGSTDWLDRATPGTEVIERKTADDITGDIVDTEGNPIQAAKIFTEADLQPVESDNEGFFRFPKAKGTQTILRAFKPGYHIWIGMPTAGDRLKIVLEKKESKQASTRTTLSNVDAGDEMQRTGEAGVSEPETDALTLEVNRMNRDLQRNVRPSTQPPLTRDEVIAVASWNEGKADLSQPIKDVLAVIATQHRLIRGWRFAAETRDMTQPDASVRVFRIFLVKDGSEQKFLIRERFVAPLNKNHNSEQLNEEQGSVPLSAAIARFNSSPNVADGIKQPPLTEDEVVAAILCEQTRRDRHDVDEAFFQQYQDIARTRALPKGAAIEVIPAFETAEGSTFTIWSVRIRLPKFASDESKGTYAFKIREQFVSVKHADAGEIHWGTPSAGGMQVGTRLRPPLKNYSIGQKVVVEFVYRNVLTKPLDASIPNIPHYEIEVRDARGTEVQTRNPSLEVVAGYQVERMIDGEQVTRTAQQLLFVPKSIESDTAPSEPAGIQTLIFVEDGESYRIRFAVPDPSSDRTERLTTGEIEITIRSVLGLNAPSIPLSSNDIGTSSFEVRRVGDWSAATRELASSVSTSSRAVPTEELIRWGDPKNGLQAGLLIPTAVTLGEQIEARLVLRKISGDEPEQLTLNGRHVQLVTLAVDRIHPATQDSLLVPLHPQVDVTLRAGEHIEFPSRRIQFGGSLLPDIRTAMFVGSKPGIVRVKFVMLQPAGPPLETGEAEVQVNGDQASFLRNRPADENDKAEIGPTRSMMRPPVTCVLLELNKPGTVEVEVSVGFEDGIRPGDKLDAIHEGQIVGKVEITRAEASRSKARIIEVVPGKALDIGAKVESPKQTQASFVDMGDGPEVPTFEVPIGISDIKDSNKKERKESVPHIGTESHLTFRSVELNGERLIELARGEKKQTASQFTVQTDAGRIEVTPGANGLIRIVRGKVEMFAGELTLRNEPEKLQISVSTD
jgi:serine/threonine protein kinase